MGRRGASPSSRPRSLCAIMSSMRLKLEAGSAPLLRAAAKASAAREKRLGDRRATALTATPRLPIA
eukprot:5651937-Pyramimonas_sp.AAC.1